MASRPDFKSSVRGRFDRRSPPVAFGTFFSSSPTCAQQAALSLTLALLAMPRNEPRAGIASGRKARRLIAVRRAGDPSRTPWAARERFHGANPDALEGDSVKHGEAYSRRSSGNGDGPREGPPPPSHGPSQRFSLRSDHKRQGAFGCCQDPPDGGTAARLAQARTIGPAPARQRIAITRQLAEAATVLAAHRKSLAASNKTRERMPRHRSRAWSRS